MEEKINNLKSLLNNISEDHREEGESIEDAYKKRDGDILKAIDDIAEDHREEGEEIEKLKKEIESLKNDIIKQNKIIINQSQPEPKKDKNYMEGIK